MASVTDFLARRLKLTMNTDKSAVGRASAQASLGFGFTAERTPRRRITPQPELARLKTRIRALTRCLRSVSLVHFVTELTRYLVGTPGYFDFCETPWCRTASTDGSVGGFVPSSGGKGSADAHASLRCAASVSTSIW